MGQKISKEQNPYKCILITGASSGIGAALAERLAASGVLLALIGRDEERVGKVSEKCHAKGAEVVASVIDVGDTAAMKGFITKVNNQRPIDLVIANAGIMGVDLPTEAALLQVLHTNLLGTINTVMPAIECMAPRQAQRRPQLAIMSSVSALGKCAVEFSGALNLGVMPYAWSKHSLMTLAEGLRGELAGKVDVSIVCPGLVTTPMSVSASQLFDAEKEMRSRGVTPEEAAETIIDGLVARQELIAFPKQAVQAMKMAGCVPKSLLLRKIRNQYQQCRKCEGSCQK